MKSDSSRIVFQSTLPYEKSRIHAAAIYCSDGRLGEHIDDFLQNGLMLPRHDRIALPGGPVCLAGHPQAHLEQQGVVNELGFLVKVHGLERIVLIAHEGCAFYTANLQLDERRRELVQRADLVRAAAFVDQVTGIASIEAYYASLIDDHLSFERVEV